jgi:hypothetical protein
LFATTVPGGAAVTLAPEPDGSEPVICSPVPEPADPPPPATDPARGPLIVDRCIEPPAPPPPSGPLSVEPAPVPAGGELRFEWTVEAAQRIVVSDEMVVSCWTGRAWTPAWIASSVFTDPRSELLAVQSVTVMTANGFEQAAGTIPIPSGAPPGTYRILAPFSLDLDDGSTDSGVAEVFFTVVPGD